MAHLGELDGLAAGAAPPRGLCACAIGAAPLATDLVFELVRRDDHRCRATRADLVLVLAAVGAAPLAADLVLELNRGVRAGEVIGCQRAQGPAERASLPSPFRVLLRWSNR